MALQLNHLNSPETPTAWDTISVEDDEPDHSLALQMAGKVVFITVQGTQQASDLATEYLRMGARVALLDIGDWALYILPTMRPDVFSDSEQKIPCHTWVEAVEEVIARFGPINLWLDARAMAWPAVSRIGGLRVAI